MTRDELNPYCGKSSAMATLDLPDAYRAKLLTLLQAHIPTAEVWAYGSRLKGQAHSASDLDLVVRNPADPSQAQPTLSGLREALSASDLPILVEILDWARIPESFREEIRCAHVVLYSPSNEARQ